MEQNSIKDKILVVIPYFNSYAQGREIEYAVTGWRRHFKEDFLIVVVGDYHPIVETGKDITFIKCPRIADRKGEYRAHLDHVNKFMKVMETYPDLEGFIYTCDDIYAVNDFTLDDVLVPKINEWDISALPTSTNPWRRNNAKTKAILKQHGLTTRNYVCHLPVYYECDKLKAIYDKYDCYNNSYVVEQLYFNTYFGNNQPRYIREDGCNYKFGISTKNRKSFKIKDAFGDKIWINNTMAGWSNKLSKALAEYYGI